MIGKRRRYISKKIEINRTRSMNRKYAFGFMIAFILMVIASIFLYLGLNVEKNMKPVYQYKIEKRTDGEVLLKANDFYATETLPIGLYYASQSIDAFIINFAYQCKGNNNINITYNYGVTADLVGIVKDEYQDKEVWNRSFTIIENKSDTQVETDGISIQEKMHIDYGTYNELVRLYEKEYGIKLNATLKIHFNITYQLDLSKYGLNTKTIDDVMEWDIPITNTVTEIDKNEEKESVGNIMPPTEKIKTIEYCYDTIAGLCIILAFMIVIIKMKKNKMTPQEKYQKKVNHILNYYRDIIITVNNEPNLVELKKMELLTLNDLIDVAEQNHCNIIHY